MQSLEMVARRSERFNSPQSYQASTQPNEKGLPQPPPQVLRFPYRGECETRVTDDEGQGTMGRSSPSRLPLRANVHRERDVWVRGRDSPRPSLIPEENIFAPMIGHWLLRNEKLQGLLLGDNLDSRAIPSSSQQLKTEDEALRRQNRTEALESKMV